MIQSLKIKNPVTFIVGNHPCVCTFEGKETNYPVASGVKFQNEHYGFIVQTNKEKKCYQTEAPLQAAYSTRLFLRIFEEGKKNSWKINAVTGQVMEKKQGIQEEKTRSI